MPGAGTHDIQPQWSAQHQPPWSAPTSHDASSSTTRPTRISQALIKITAAIASQAPKSAPFSPKARLNQAVILRLRCERI